MKLLCSLRRHELGERNYALAAGSPRPGLPERREGRG